MKAISIILSAAVAMAISSACSGQKTDQQANTAADPAATEASAPAAVLPATPTGDVAAFTGDAGLTPQTKVVYPVIMDFNATWCGPCKRFTPVFDAVAKKYGSRAQFYTVDVDQNPKTAEAFGATNIPQVTILLPDGTVQNYVGLEEITPEAAFDAIVAKYTK